MPDPPCPDCGVPMTHIHKSAENCRMVCENDACPRDDE